MDFSFLAIAFNIKKMCARMNKMGIKGLIGHFYSLISACLSCREQNNREYTQNVAA